MKKNRFTIVTLCVIFFCIPCFGETMDNIIDAECKSKLAAENDIFGDVQFNNVKVKLLPQCAPLQKIFNEKYGLLNPSILVESLSFVKKPESWSREGAWTAEEKTHLLDEVTSLSTLAGLSYYSESKKTMRVFYETSQVIDTPKNKLALADPIFKTDSPLPKDFVLFARQKDLTFGDNIYRYDYYVDDNAVIFTQSNVTTISFGIIPLVPKEKLLSLVAFIDTNDGILVYITTMTKVVLLPGMKDKIGASFTNRLKAILSWFKSKDL